MNGATVKITKVNTNKTSSRLPSVRTLKINMTGSFIITIPKTSHGQQIA